MPQTSLYRSAAALGLVRRYLNAERRQLVAVRFFGDVPRRKRFGLFKTNWCAPLDHPGRDDLPPHERQNILSYPLLVEPKPNVKQHRNVLYTPDGFAWCGAILDETMSVRAPEANRDLMRPLRAAETISKGTLLHGEHSETFGDWMCEQSKSMALAGHVPEPVLLPRFLYEKAYVQKEFERLGLETRAIDKPTLVKEATAIIKPQPHLVWSADDVAAYRSFHGLDPKQPRPGSFVYLSREGATSELSRATRSYPSDIVAEIVEELGGRVVQTGTFGYEDFLALAEDAETVIADHGAAMFNMVYWRTKSVLELVPDNWWDGCFVFLSAALKIRHHEVLNFGGLDKSALKARIEAHLSAVADIAPDT